jgi:glycopeptide antibiotics resistance protein
VFSALHVAQQFLLYLPLGALLAIWPLRLSGKWSNLWPGLGVAVAIELGHIVVAGRTFDVTNILLACAGLAMGWVAVRRSGYQPYGAALRDATSRPSRRS